MHILPRLVVPTSLRDVNQFIIKFESFAMKVNAKVSIAK